MNNRPIRIIQTASALLWLLSGCVKKSEYDALQMENQALQKRVDQASRYLQQYQAEMSALQIQIQQFAGVQAQLEKTRQELNESQAAYERLKSEFDRFRIQRRSAMMGKKFPVLNLDDGRVLREAEITSIDAEEISLRHADGVIKIALAKTSDDLRWEACYDVREASDKALEKQLAKARESEAREQNAPVQPPAAPQPTRQPVDILRSQLAAQRTALNTEYRALAAKNPAALRGAPWNSIQPEASPLLNTVSGGRAVLGISRLYFQRDAILATLRELRGLDPTAR